MHFIDWWMEVKNKPSILANRVMNLINEHVNVKWMSHSILFLRVSYINDKHTFVLSYLTKITVFVS